MNTHVKKPSLAIICLIFCFFVFLSIATASKSRPIFKETGVLSVCAYTEFKPISYGNGQGYEADLLRAITKQWRVKIKFYPENIYEGIWLAPSRPNSHCDIAMAGISPEIYRKKQGAVFSIATGTYEQSLLVRKQDYLSGRIVSYKSFKNTNKKIGVVPGSAGELYAKLIAKENGVPLSAIVQYESESALLPALNKGEIDAIARGAIGNEFQASLDKHLMTIARRNFDEKFVFAVDPTNKELLSELNQAISKLTDNGKIGYAQWLKNPNVFNEQVKKQ